MANKDVNAMVLDAFRVEHREQLEQIRLVLGTLRPGDAVADDPRVQEAFRLAHSLKGGARVCDLSEAERLGHGLESVFEQLSDGSLPLTEVAIATINRTLDCIEDWMASLEQEAPFPDTSEALENIGRLIGEATVAAPVLATPDHKNQRLLDVFAQEYADHAAKLAQSLSLLSAEGRRPEEAEYAEALQSAHTLAGAAAVVGRERVESLAQSIGELFRTASVDRRCLDLTARSRGEEILAAMAVEMGETGPLFPRRFDAVRTPEAAGAAETAPRATDVSGPALAASGETVRVGVESLDRLMRSVNDMLEDNLRVRRVTRQMVTLQRDVEELDREREAVRQSASASLHRLSAVPEFKKIAGYLELVDRQVKALAKLARRVSNEQRRTEWVLQSRAAQLQSGVRQARLAPAHGVFQGFRKMVRDLAKAAGKDIDFHVSGLDVRADRVILQALKNPIMHALRNCVTHGIERPAERLAKGKPAAGSVFLSLEVTGSRLCVAVEDDGRGIDSREIRLQAVRSGQMTESAIAQLSTEEVLSLAFRPGFSTLDHADELAGRGMGLSVVQDSVERLQGRATLSQSEHGGLRVAMTAPVCVSTHRVLLVACGDQTFAMPVQAIDRLLRVHPDEVESVEDQPVVVCEETPLRLLHLSSALGLAAPTACRNADGPTPVVVLKHESRRMALRVDLLLEERDALILNLDRFSDSSRFAGGVPLEDGRVALVIQASELIEQAPRHVTPPTIAPTGAVLTAPRRVLIVDDSFTTRTLEKSILESRGYSVGVAVDGIEALTQLRNQRFALVISDIEMPRMDGFTLVEKMKSDTRLATTPVILVTSRDKQEDKQRGLNLGADAYIVKRKFDHEDLLDTIEQLL